MGFSITLSKELVDRLEVFPEKLLSTIEDKLEQLVKLDQASGYEIYSSLLISVWNKLRFNPFPLEFSIDVKAAQGTPHLKGLTLRNSNDERYLFKLSIDQIAPSSLWQLEWLLVHIDQRLKNANIHGKYSIPQIESCLERSKRGFLISGVGIKKESGNDLTKEAEGSARFLWNKRKEELYLSIRSSKALTQLANSNIIELVKKYLIKIERNQNRKIIIPAALIKKRISDCLSGPEQIGINYPVEVLAAYSLVDTNQQNQTDSTTTKDNQDEKSDTKVLDIRISEDRMRAYIHDFDTNIYHLKNNVFSKSWIENQLIMNRLSKESYNKELPFIEEYLNNKNNLTGLIVARGRPFQGPENPSIVPLFEPLLEEENIYELNQGIKYSNPSKNAIVEKDTLIARVEYDQPYSEGIDVHGENVIQNSQDSLGVHIGPGVIEKGYGEFWSDVYGLPKIHGKKIEIMTVKIYETDVVSKSNNLNVEGPIEIRGDVYDGAHVVATGDIIIRGNVEASTVISRHGSITVFGGIITNERYKIQAAKNIIVNYIENSNILAGENIQVKKSILNSNVFVGGSLIVLDNPGGLIAGGKIVVGKNISVCKIGFESGKKTSLKSGDDWHREYKISINEKRKNELEQYIINLRASLRDRVKSVHNDNDIALGRDVTNTKIARTRKIISYLNRRLKKIRSGLAYNQSAKVLIWGQTQGDVDITISGRYVPVNGNLREVAIKGGQRLNRVSPLLSYLKKFAPTRDST